MCWPAEIVPEAITYVAGAVVVPHLGVLSDGLDVCCHATRSGALLESGAVPSALLLPSDHDVEDRHLEKLRRQGEDARVHYVSVCSPADAHVRLALRVHADAICEKPLVLSPWNIDQLVDLEGECGRRV